VEMDGTSNEQKLQKLVNLTFVIEIELTFAVTLKTPPGLDSSRLG